MIIQLQPEQVSDYWDQIKFVALTVMGTDNQRYVQSLLSALLSETHQCWIILDDSRELVSLGVTCIVEERLSGNRCLQLELFYSFHTLAESLAREATEYVKKYAVAVGCKQIKAQTLNPRAARLLEIAGFYAGKTEYILDAL